jgi:probable rRNA maturation factor
MQDALGSHKPSSPINHRNMSIVTEIQFVSRKVKLPKTWIEKTVQLIASDYGWTHGEISIAIVDDPQIHQVNLQYLRHDYPTDVISFDTTESDDFLEGEVIASAQTAKRIADENHWQASHELLLYIIHGMLHVIGLDDTTAAKAKQMRANERHYLQAILKDTTVCTEAR